MDLHTGNICADRWGYLKLIDFGLALKNNDKAIENFGQEMWRFSNWSDIDLVFVKTILYF